MARRSQSAMWLRERWKGRQAGRQRLTSWGHLTWGEPDPRGHCSPSTPSMLGTPSQAPLCPCTGQSAPL